MKHQIARPDLLAPCGIICLACILLLSILSVTADAQVELRADRQIFFEATHGTQTIKKGPGNKLYVLTRSVKPPSSLWISDYSGSSMRMILGGGSEPSLRVPKDFAVDRDGNAIVVDAGLIKIFSTDGKLLSSFPSDRPESVGVLSDGRILVSGLPKDGLISVFGRQGVLLGHIGETIRVDDAPGFNAVLNAGNIVVDDDDNIYYVFRFLLTPTVRKYTREGKLVAEWHPESPYLDQAIAHAKKIYESNKDKGILGGNRVLTAGAFDTETKSLWVASGPEVLQLDSSGKTIRNFELFLAEGGPPLQVQGLLVDRDFIRAAGPLHGTFEFFKPH
jgi:hypothetical protein